MGAQAIDYAALARQAGAISSTPPGKVDYTALAKQAGAVSSTPPDAARSLQPQKWQPARSQAEYDQQQREYAQEVARWYGAGMPDVRPQGTQQPVGSPSVPVHTRVSNAVGNVAMSPMTTVMAPKQTFEGMLAAGNNGADELSRGTSDSAFPLLRMLTNVPNALSAASGGDPAAARDEMARGNTGRAVAAYAAAPAVGLGASLIHPGSGASLLDAAHDLPSAVADAGRFAAKAPAEVARRIFAGDVNKPILGEGVATTPLNRYQAAQRVGVNLNAADATNAPIPKTARLLSQYGIGSQGVFAQRGAENIGALHDATTSLLNDMSPYTGEAGGVRLQGLLKDRQELMHNMAQEEFNNVSRDYGHLPLSEPGYQPLMTEAAKIAQENAPHASQFPSLVPKTVASIVRDASNFGPETSTSTVTSPLLDEYGKPIQTQVTKTTTPTVSDLIRARSSLMDVYRNNPEIVKSASDADLQRLTEAAHKGVQDSLPPSGQVGWEAGNDYWRQMKNTFDNNQSPFYHAVRTDSPSTLAKGVGAPTPENVRALAATAGEEGRDIVQRGKTEDLLGRDRNGEFNFPTFGRRFNALSPDYRTELFGPNESRLKDIAVTGNALTKDFNPSGTAKVGVPVGQATLLATSILHGDWKTAALQAAAVGLQYPTAKLLNSPAAVDWLMTPKPINIPKLPRPPSLFMLPPSQGRRAFPMPTGVPASTRPQATQGNQEQRGFPLPTTSALSPIPVPSDSSSLQGAPMGFSEAALRYLPAPLLGKLPTRRLLPIPHIGTLA